MQNLPKAGPYTNNLPWEYGNRMYIPAERNTVLKPTTWQEIHASETLERGQEKAFETSNITPSVKGGIKPTNLHSVKLSQMY